MKESKDYVFSEYDFISLLLPLLYKNGVYEIDENELAKELYYYYKNPNYRELFEDICLIRNGFSNKVDIHNGLYREKFFSGRIKWDSMRCTPLRLFYADTDVSFIAKRLDEERSKKIEQMAKEIGIRDRIKKKNPNRINIYGVNPNKTYLLIAGRKFGQNIGIEMVTDGCISKTIPIKLTENIFFASPYNVDDYITYENAKAICVEIKNATYAIEQGITDDKINFLNLFTESINEDVLERTSKIGSVVYSDGDSITEQKPFVKRIVLK